MVGGRLIFTNLRDTDAFPKRTARIPDVRLPYQIVQDADVRLASAAALNANFPPVFPTARIRIPNDGSGDCAYRSYYVTDGGAEENLGLISALYALESALESALAKFPNGVRLRPIHVVIAEASGVSYDYGQDRGISALFGGSNARLAGGLTNAVLERVEEKLRSVDAAQSSVEFHYLGLPLAFRARGGFGTNWIYAKEYNLNDPRPRTTAKSQEAKATVSREVLEELWLALHDPDQFFCGRDHSSFKSHDAEKVQTWLCGSPPSDPTERDLHRDLHMEEWIRLVDTIKKKYPKP